MLGAMTTDVVELSNATPADLIDLGRYPLTDLHREAGRTMVAGLRAQLAHDGTCRLPGFLRPAAVTALAAEAEALAPLAFRAASHPKCAVHPLPFPIPVHCAQSNAAHTVCHT